MRVAASEKAEIHRPCFGGLQHFSGIEGAARINANRDWTKRTTDHGGDPAGQRMLDQTCAVEVNVHVDRAGCGDQYLAIPYGGARGHDEARINTIHNRGVAGLAESDDTAVPNTEIGLDDPENGIDHGNIAQQEIQRTISAGNTGHSYSVTECLAAAVQAFVAINGMVLLNDGCQRRVA